MPKAKTPSVYLSDHDTPEAAIEAAIADARSESAAARRFKRAYAPLVESLKLPASIEDSDDAVSAARDAARDAVTGLQAAGGEGEIIESLKGILDAYAEHTGVDLLAVLDNLPEKATDEDVDARIVEAFKPLSSLKAEAQEAAQTRTKLTYIEAAGSEYDPAKLQKIAPGLTAREIEKDGQKVTEYGIPGEGDAWTPLADAVSGWEASLKRDAAPKPAPAPLPLGGAGGKPQPKTADQIAAEKRTRAEYSI